MRVPHDEVGSIVSQPRARELPGTALFIKNKFTISRVNGGGTPLSPRAERNSARANAPTSGADR